MLMIKSKCIRASPDGSVVKKKNLPANAEHGFDPDPEDPML